NIRSGPVAAAVRPVPLVLQVAAWRAPGSKRPGYVRRRELPVDRCRGVPRYVSNIPPCCHLAQVIQVIAGCPHALVAERLPQLVAMVGLAEQNRGAGAIGNAGNADGLFVIEDQEYAVIDLRWAENAGPTPGACVRAVAGQRTVDAVR